MGRSVGAQAARAVAAGQTKAAKAEVTTERAIAEIRALRTSNLHVGNDEYVDKLLAAYDELQTSFAHVSQACSGLLLRAENAEAELASVHAKNHFQESEAPCTTV